MKTFSWIPFYRSLASAIAGYSSNPEALFEIISKLSSGVSLMEYLHFDKPEFWGARNNNIDPFTIMAIFNRGVTDTHRTELAEKLAGAFGIKETPPTEFHGIAHLDPRNSIYSHPRQIWELFMEGMRGGMGKNMQTTWDNAMEAGENGLAMLSIALFWINPKCYMPLDGMSIPYLSERYNMKPLQRHATGREYIDFMEKLAGEMKPDQSYPQLAFEAWQAAQINKSGK